jgi:hypothetical protein
LGERARSWVALNRPWSTNARRILAVLSARPLSEAA